MSQQQPHVFISYVSENSEVVDQLYQALIARGVKVWFSRTSIEPGTRWKEQIRQGIQDGGFFLACFSAEYLARQRTHMNEELHLAIDELRQRHGAQPWFIPVKLNPCDIPDIRISAVETLNDLHYVELYPSLEAGVQRLLSVILPPAAGEKVSPEEAVLQRAEALLDAEEYEKAVRALETVPPLSPQAGRAHLLHALALLKGRSFNSVRVNIGNIERQLNLARRKSEGWSVPLVLLAVMEIDYYHCHGMMSRNDVSIEEVKARVTENGLSPADLKLCSLVRASAEARHKIGLV